jgi:cystathionine gamma-synthase
VPPFPQRKDTQQSSPGTQTELVSAHELAGVYQEPPFCQEQNGPFGTSSRSGKYNSRMGTPPLGSSQPAAPPLFAAAVYQLPNLDALEQISSGAAPGFIYARDQHPNGVELEAKLARLEGANWAIVAGSGMAALGLACLAALAPGERLLVSDQLYGRTTQLATLELPRLGIACDVVDTLDVQAVAAAMDQSAVPPRLLIVETITNPLMRVTPVAALAALCRERGVKLLVDNTFAAPLLCRPLELGATWVVESLTKLIAGHSDVTLGLLAGNDDSETRLRHLRSVWGFQGAPFDCWLTLRGLETFALRQAAACRNAAHLADWLAAQAAVARVRYPGCEPADRPLVEALLGGRGGTMLSFELAGGREAVKRFLVRGAIPFCPSLGDVRTTCSYPAATSHRYVPEDEKTRLGITPGLVRLSVGCEPIEDLQTRLCAALAG